MEIKTKFNIGEKVFFTLNSILAIVKTNPFYTDKEIFDRCFGEGFVVGIEIYFNVNDEKPRIRYTINDRMRAEAEDIEMLKYSGAMYDEEAVSNNRGELEKTIHDIHIAELKMINEKIVNLMK